MEKTFRAIDDLAFRMEGVILFGVLTSLVIILAMQVVFRFFLDQPLDFTEEIARLLFSWLVFIGAARAMRVSQHFLVDVVYNTLPRGLRRPVGYLIDAVTVTFVGLLFWIGLTASINGAGQIMPVMQISASAQTADLPAGMLHDRLCPYWGSCAASATRAHLRRTWRTGHGLSAFQGHPVDTGLTADAGNGQ